MKQKEFSAAELQLSSTSRKALTVQLGEAAGREVAELIHRLAERIERLERSKVDIMPVVPSGRSGVKQVSATRCSV